GRALLRCWCCGACRRFSGREALRHVCGPRAVQRPGPTGRDADEISIRGTYLDHPLTDFEASASAVATGVTLLDDTKTEACATHLDLSVRRVDDEALRSHELGHVRDEFPSLQREALRRALTVDPERSASGQAQRRACRKLQRSAAFRRRFDALSRFDR